MSSSVANKVLRHFSSKHAARSTILKRLTFSPLHLLQAVFFAAIITAASPLMTSAYSETAKLSLAERLKAKAAAIAAKTKLRLENIDKAQIIAIRDAMIIGVEYGRQAKRDEEAGYELAHQKAAYEWGYAVGDPKTVKLVRLYWEGVQLGVFGIGDIQQHTGSKSPKWAMLESAVGGNGEEYDINRAYIDDIFDDVQIAVDGANAAKGGIPLDFSTYWENSGR